MKRAANLLLLLVLGLRVSSPECPTTSICPQDGQNGNPTGEYKWQGSVEFEKFSHPTSTGQHVWWDRCT